MDLCIVGLGRMGAGIAQRWLRAGHRVAGYDIRTEALEALTGSGLAPAYSLSELVERTVRPRFVWLMLPDGQPTQETASQLLSLLEPGDTLADGGNTNYRESIDRAAIFKDAQINFLDIGTSAGIWGLSQGFCLMVGGDRTIYEAYEQAFSCLTPTGGYAHVGQSGAGHYTKMIHNGIEYGLLQAYAEGFEILSKNPFSIDLAETAELWRNGSLIQSWLLDMLAAKLKEDPTLGRHSDYVEDLGTGRWAVLEAIDKDVPTPAIAMALLMRLRSRQNPSFASKVVSALREEFGGHDSGQSRRTNGQQLQ